MLIAFVFVPSLLDTVANAGLSHQPLLFYNQNTLTIILLVCLDLYIAFK